MDRGHEALGCSVIKVGWRLKRSQLQIDGDRVALASAYCTPISADSKTLLIILSNNLLQRLVSQRHADTIGDGDQVINVCPPVVVKCETILLGLMPQNQAQEFAQTYELRIHHYAPASVTTIILS